MAIYQEHFNCRDDRIVINRITNLIAGLQIGS